jgi:probable HAF family extracellular repeat protein
MLSAALALTVPQAAQAGLYSVKSLGAISNPAGRTDSIPNGINSAGHVVAINAAGGAYRAFVYGSAATNLGTLGGGESYGNGINDAGRAVGRSSTASGVTHAFLWTPGGTDGVPANLQMKDLGTLGGSNSEATDINAIGQITGYAETATRARAFRYSGGTMTDIGALLGNSLPNSFGYSINDAGHVVGAAYNANYTAPHAFFYNGATAIDLGNLGGQASTAIAINNHDRIVGYLTTTDSVDHAFSYVAGVMTDLGTLGGHYSYALAINNSNVIVGGSFTDAADSLYRAFVIEGAVMTDLNTRLDASSAGWILVEARCINDAGQIAGTGTFGGAGHFFLLTPVTSAVAPEIVGIQVSGTDAIIRFTTVAQASYSLLARTNLSTGNWSPVINSIVGTGGVVTVTNSGGATFPAQFYRVAVSP